MRTVKVNKTELLTELIANKAKHVAAYEKAINGYQKANIKSLAAQSRKCKADRTHVPEVDQDRPTSYEQDYATAIKQVEMSVDTVIELTDVEFRRYVMDRWEWSAVAASNFSKYSNT